MCLVHVDDNIVASGCMAFARPSSAAVLGFLCIKLHTTDSLEQVVHEDQTAEHRRERTSTPKTTRHTSPQERTRTDKHLNKNSPRQKVQEEFKTSSSSRQLQTKFQEHATNKHVMILSCKGISYGSAISQTLLQLHHWIIFIP